MRELQVDARRKKRRTRLVLFGVIPLVALGGGLVVWRLNEQSAERDIRAAWSLAAGCLVGKPLADSERASLRVRAIQLGAVAETRKLPEKERWPCRCADAVAELQVKLRQHGRDGGGAEGLAQRAEQLALRLRALKEELEDVSAEVDGLFQAARAAGLAADSVALPRPTPEPAEALTLDALPETARLTPLQYTLDRVSTTPMVGTELHLLIYDQRLDKAPLLCSFSLRGPDRCRKLTGELRGRDGIALGSTAETGASPLVFVGRDGEAGIYRSDPPAKITAMAADSAYVDRQGHVAIASTQLHLDGRFELLQQPSAGAELTRATITPEQFEPKATRIVEHRMLWDKLLVLVADPDAEVPPRLQYLELPAADPAQPFQDIATLDQEGAILGCRTPETLIVRMGWQAGSVAFFSGEGWSKPVVAEEFLPAFSCDKGEAVFTDADGTQQRCTPAGCQQTPGVPPAYRPFNERAGALADVGGKILAVALTDDRGGIRCRYAAGLQLAEVGQDQLLFDDLVVRGAVQGDSAVLDIRLLGRGRFAVLLLSTPLGLYALRFDEHGKPTPATIQQEG